MRPKNLTTVLHSAVGLASFPAYRAFQKSLRSLASTQLATLKTTIKHCKTTGYGKSVSLSQMDSYASFAKRVPVVGYDTIADRIIDQMTRDHGQISRANTKYMPTSGSTSKHKWVPYNKHLNDAFDRVSAAWIFDLARQYPQILTGRHYWSLSWMPNDLRNHGSTVDDLEIMPKWKQLLWKKVMVSPKELATVATSEDAVFATCCYLLAASDMTLMSVWSPTFALSMFRFIEENHEKIAETLDKGRWVLPYQNALSHIAAPQHQQAAQYLREFAGEMTPESSGLFWPRLAVMSAWDTHSSRQPAEQLRQIIPQAAFQGKGLWATEGVVTIPFEGCMPLAANGHFYEFENLDSGEIIPSWQLKKGMTCRPILTCGNGFLRYRMDDVVRVAGFLYDTPTLIFEGRYGSTDMAGEKLSPQIIQPMLEELASRYSLKPISLVGVQSQTPKPYYNLIAEGLTPNDTSAIQSTLEEELMTVHHYKLARELGQIDQVKVTVAPKLLDRFIDVQARKDTIKGAIKIDPVTYWRGEKTPEEELSTPTAVNNN